MDSVLGSRTEIKPEDLFELKYTNSVFKETLRLWPSGAAFGRETLGDFKINKFDIPENSWIEVIFRCFSLKLMNGVLFLCSLVRIYLLDAKNTSKIH